MPAREKTSPDVLPRSVIDGSVCEVLLRFGGIVLACCQGVCDVLGFAAMETEVPRWHLLISFAPSFPTPGTRHLISTSPLGGVAGAHGAGATVDTILLSTGCIASLSLAIDQIFGFYSQIYL
jgi:hypothetical protein